MLVELPLLLPELHLRHDSLDGRLVPVCLCVDQEPIWVPSAGPVEGTKMGDTRDGLCTTSVEPEPDVCLIGEAVEVEAESRVGCEVFREPSILFALFFCHS